jgi:hypothetical protein
MDILKSVSGNYNPFGHSSMIEIFIVVVVVVMVVLVVVVVVFLKAASTLVKEQLRNIYQCWTVIRNRNRTPDNYQGGS